MTDLKKQYQMDYKVPPDMRVYAIGDIHGMVDMLDELHHKISIDLVQNPIKQTVFVYLGDYVDRGQNSKAVINKLIERQHIQDDIERHFLLGNHEQAMLEFMISPYSGSNWLNYGGDKTLQDYGVPTGEPPFSMRDYEYFSQAMGDYIPAAHMEFLKGLELSITIGDYIFVHAGINPEKPISQQDKRDLTFIREPFLSWQKPFEKCVVHGHTPVDQPDIRSNRINVDTGAVYNGQLTAVALENNIARFLNI